MRGKHPIRVSDPDVDQTFIHLEGSGLKPETDLFIIIFQDQYLATRNYEYNTLEINNSHLAYVENIRRQLVTLYLDVADWDEYSFYNDMIGLLSAYISQYAIHSTSHANKIGRNISHHKL